MYFCHILVILLHTFFTSNPVVAEKVKVNRPTNGVDEFEVLDDEMESICTDTKNVAESCVKRDAISIQNNGACSDREEKLHCRCNSTKPTFLLHEDRCVNNENVTRYLHKGTYPVCKFHLADRNPPRCQRSPVSTLSTNLSNTRSYSLCTADVNQEFFNCKVNLSSLLYSKAGRWRRLWRLDPRGQLGSGQENTLALEELFVQLISNASRYSGLTLSFQATCLKKSKLGVRLRGYPPPDQMQSCLLFKVSGSRIWSLKPHQMNYSSLNETDLKIKRNLNTTTTEQSPTSFPTGELVPDETKINEVDKTIDWKLWYFVLGVCAGGACVVVVLAFACYRWESRFSKGTRRLRRRIQRLKRSIANPTYERGVDSGLVLVPVSGSSPSGSPTAAVVSPYAIVYQPLVENTRPFSVNGYSNLYESLRSVRNNPALRRYSYSLYQDLVRARNANSSPGCTYQETVVNFKTSARVSLPTTRLSDSSSSTAASNARCDYAIVRKKLPRDPEEKFPKDETKTGDLTVMCQSISSSSQQGEGIASGNEIAARSSSMLSLSSLQFYEDEDQKVLNPDSEDNSDCYVQDRPAQHDIFKKSDNMCSKSGTPHDGVYDGTSECRLSALEFTLDSDCSECDSAFGEVIDETETQSPFYFVLEESKTTPEKEMSPSVSLV